MEAKSVENILPRPKTANEALTLLKDGTDIEIENLYVFDFMRYVKGKERNISFTCKVNMIISGWTVISNLEK